MSFKTIPVKIGPLFTKLWNFEVFTKKAPNLKMIAPVGLQATTLLLIDSALQVA
jgi:hypothetical protein